MRHGKLANIEVFDNETEKKSNYRSLRMRHDLECSEPECFICLTPEIRQAWRRYENLGGNVLRHIFMPWFLTELSGNGEVIRVSLSFSGIV